MAAFLLGLTIRTVTDPLSPVLVASRNIDEDETLRKDDVAVEHHRVSTIPFGVLTSPDQIDNLINIRKIRCGQYIFPEDLSDFVGRFHIPQGRKVVAMRLKVSQHSLALHLFSQGDRVSLSHVAEDENGVQTVERIADSAIVFSSDESEHDDQAIVGLVVTEEQGDRIYAVQRAKTTGKFVFDRPENAE